MVLSDEASTVEMATTPNMLGVYTSCLPCRRPTCLVVVMGPRVQGKRQVSVSVSDEGGGMSLGTTRNAFKYLWTSSGEMSPPFPALARIAARRKPSHALPGSVELLPAVASAVPPPAKSNDVVHHPGV